MVFTYILGPIGLMTFRKLDPERKRPFYLPFANIIALSAFIIGTLIIYWSTFDILWKLGIGIAAGIVLFIFTNFNRIRYKFKQTVIPGIWFLMYIASILTISFLGSRNFGGINAIESPYDSLAAVLIAVLFYFIAINVSIDKEEMKMIIEEEFIGEEFEI